MSSGGRRPNDKNLAAWPGQEARALPGPAQCLAFALRTRQVHGIWGALTEEERRQAAKTSQAT
jgi:Transcription factor WhiB